MPMFILSLEHLGDFKLLLILRLYVTAQVGPGEEEISL